MLQPVFWALQLLILAAGLLVMAASLVLGAWVRRSLLTGPGLGSRPAASSWGLASEYSSQSQQQDPSRSSRITFQQQQEDEEDRGKMGDGSTQDRWRQHGAKDKGQQQELGGIKGKVAEKLTGSRSPQDLPPQYVRFLESGYLEAMRALRDNVLAEEWDGHGRRAALHAAVARFEAECAAEGIIGPSAPAPAEASAAQAQAPKQPQQQWARATKGKDGAGIEQQRQQQQNEQQQAKRSISYEEISALYENPEDLAVVKDAVLRARLRAMREGLLDERLREAHRDATKRAEDMAAFLRTGPGSVLDALKKLLPLPGFLKGD